MAQSAPSFQEESNSNPAKGNLGNGSSTSVAQIGMGTIFSLGLASVYPTFRHGRAARKH